MHLTPEQTPQRADAALVVQNGRLAGVQRTLSVPLTLIGRAEGCDVRLNVDGVAPLHCALVHGTEGVLLRDLAGEGILVNGEPADTTLLQDGATLAIGPFHFRLHLPARKTDAAGRLVPEDVQSLEREREALRVQAAAVVAQQAALGEAEARLEQRRAELQRQEEQLAGHLEEKRCRLEELQKQVRESREALRQEREEHERRTQQQLRDHERARTELTRMARDSQAERTRLHRLRQRLQARSRRHLQAERTALERRAAELGGRQRQLEQEAERLDQARAALAEARLRYNGEVELGRRRLQDGWDQLFAQQRRWQQTQEREQAALRECQRQSEQRAAAVASGEQDLQEQWQHWEAVRLDLQKETEGLENRIRNQRRRLTEQEPLLPRPEPGKAVQPSTAMADEGQASAAPRSSRNTAPTIVIPREGLAPLETLAGELADQRLQLAEQCEQLEIVRQQWRQEHAAMLGELEAAGVTLGEREQAVVGREQALSTAEYALRQRHEEVARTRQHLEGWLARLAVREAAWVGERERLLARLQAQEEAAQRQWQALVDLRRRWLLRRRQEMRRLRAEHDRCQSFRHQCAGLWEECFRRRTALEQKERLVAERNLAMEQFRLECLSRAADSVAADKSIERLRRRWAALGVEAERSLARDRQGVEVEWNRLQDFSRRLQEQAADLAHREEELSGRQSAWEQERMLAETAGTRLRQELQSLQAQRDNYERQLGELRDEVERVARLLIEGSEPAVLTVAQAA